MKKLELVAAALAVTFSMSFATAAYAEKQPHMSEAAKHLKQAEEHLDAVDAALARVEAGSYGTCVRCGQPIPEGRLEARPTATTCVACAPL